MNWFTEIEGDILERFDMYLNGEYRPWVNEQPADDFYLVHCVSGDNAQGAGFAKVLNDRYHFRDGLCADLAESFPGFGTDGWIFDKRFGDFFRAPLLRDSNGRYDVGKIQRMRFEGEIGHIYETERCPHILGLVTKDRYYEKPTTLMNEQKERLDLQIRENYVSLINRKLSLYPQWMFGLVDFDNGVRMVNSYLQKLNRKEIRRNQKCEERTYHDLMCDHIKSETGIAVKSIDEVAFYGYERSYIIYFTDEKYGKHLRWQIPNLKNQRYNPKMYYPMEFGKDATPNFDEVLHELDMELCIVTERTETCIKLETVASFPDDVTKLEDFGKKFEERVKGR